MHIEVVMYKGFIDFYFPPAGWIKINYISV
jgi:hypothetical protein